MDQDNAANPILIVLFNEQVWALVGCLGSVALWLWFWFCR